MRDCDRLPVDPLRPSARAIRRGTAAICAGRVVAAPTDTIYGLLADPANERAVRRVFRLKGRPEHKPLLLLIDSPARLAGVVGDLPAAFAPLAAEFWPGPLTLVLPAAPGLSPSVTAGGDTVAVRLPRSPLVRALARAAKRPLTGTSANRSGRLGARSADEVAAQVGRRLDLLLDAGAVRRIQPSTVLDIASGEPRVLREGRVSRAAIERALRRPGRMG